MAESEDRAVTLSAGLIGGLTLLSRVMGLARDIVFANFFGAKALADAFFVAFSIPNMLRRLVGEGSLTMSFVPVFTEELEKHGRDDALRLAHTAMTVSVIILAAITAAGILVSRPLVMVMAPGFQEIAGKIDLTVRLTQLMFPYTFFICLVALAMGILNSFRHFTAPALAPVLLNISLIVCIVFLHGRFNQPGMSLVIGVLAGGCLQLALQLPWLWRFGIRFRPAFAFAHPALKRIGLLMLPSVFGVAITQINLFISTIFVSPFPGGRSYLFYADRLVEFPLGIFAIALGTAILPTLSKYAAQEDMESLSDSLGYGLRLLALVIIPAMIGLIVLRVPLFNLIYERGEFTHVDTLSAGRALLFFSFGLWAFAGIRVVVPAFYSLKDAKTPVAAGFAAMLINIAGCLTLPRILGFSGVVLSISIAAAVNFSLLLFILSRRLPRLEGRRIFSCIFKIALGCIPMFVAVYPISMLSIWDSGGNYLLKSAWMGAAVAVGIIVYMFFIRILKVRELEVLLDIMKKMISRKKQQGC